MVMMSLKLTGEIPFREVYVHGLIRDAKGQKMSKSKGNVLDPIDLMDGIDLEKLIHKRVAGLLNPKQADDITQATKEEFPHGIPAIGADALRFTFASLASTGRDIKFDLSRAEGYRNFCNKIWNAARFVLSRLEGTINDCEDNSLIGRWMKARLSLRIAAIHEHLAHYRFDLYARELYELVWEDFCDWYLECAKVDLSVTTQKEATQATLCHTLETILRLLHPVMPFITEELWHALAPFAGIQATSTSIMVQPYPQSRPCDNRHLAAGNFLVELTRAIRSLRTQMNIGPQTKVPLLLEASDEVDDFLPYLMTLARLQKVEKVATLPTRQAPIGVLGEMRFMLVVEINEKEEIARLQSALQKMDQEVERVSAKLANESFLTRAPQAIIQKEREKKETLLQEREALMAQLQHLASSAAKK
jgi:valyl-tRNA synthetase